MTAIAHLENLVPVEKRTRILAAHPDERLLLRQAAIEWLVAAKQGNPNYETGALLNNFIDLAFALGYKVAQDDLGQSCLECGAWVFRKQDDGS
jgi:hypothetical protein